jgi:hypothetical protein
MQIASHARRLAAVMGAATGVGVIGVASVHADAAAVCRGGPGESKNARRAGVRAEARGFEPRMGLRPKPH